MAGGVFAFVVLMIILLCIGFGGIAAGIVGTILFNKARKKGKKIGKPLTIVSAVVLSISILITALPFCAYVFFYVNAPKESPKTDIIIEERVHQDERFTADGVVYEYIGIDNLEVLGDDFSEPLFSYEVKFYLFPSSWGCYYKLENDYGFNFVIDDNMGRIYCPADEKEKAREFLNDNSRYEWHYNNYDSEADFDDVGKLINDDGQKFLFNLLDTYNSEPETIRIKAKFEDYNEYEFELYSKDNFFAKDVLTITEHKGKYYIETDDVKFLGTTETYTAEVIEIDDVSAKKLIDSLD